MKGKNINGYILKDFLGQGTFGNTWLVEKEDREYAMKLFKREMIRNHKDELRIKREISSLQAVDHQNVTKYIDDGEYNIGYEKYKYLVMEYANGVPLSNYILSKGKLTIKDACSIISQVLDGLSAIHEAGLLHRDLKPDNIFVTMTGEIKILDFGLVKVLDASTLTNTGATLGTYAYMAPEQLKDSKNIDTRADLYSVGAVLFHMVTGRIPIEMNSLAEVPYKIMEFVPEPASTLNPSVPQKLDELISNLLEKEVYWRKYVSAIDIKSAINNLEDKIIVDLNQKIDLKYLPRLLHNERTIIEDFINISHLDGIVFQANFLPKYEAVYNSAKEAGCFTFIDPLVYRLAYSKFTNTKSLKELPYVISEISKEKPSDFNNIASCKSRAKKVVDWQLKYKADVVISPFHYLSSIDDEWIDKDLIVFNECKKYMEENKISHPLYTGIMIHVENICDNQSCNTLITKITRIQPDGFFLMFDIDMNTKIQAHYYWFTKFINLLSSQGKPIILSRVNSFGLLTIPFGTTGISSGVGYIESFKESILIEENSGYNMKPKYYIPELMSSFNKEELKEILAPSFSKKYICNCRYCKGSSDVDYLLDNKIAKGHFLTMKQKEMSQLNSMLKEEQYRFLESRLINAISELKDIKKVTKSKKIEYDFMNTWLDTIRKINSEQTNVFITATGIN